MTADRQLQGAAIATAAHAHPAGCVTNTQYILLLQPCGSASTGTQGHPKQPRPPEGGGMPAQPHCHCSQEQQRRQGHAYHVADAHVTIHVCYGSSGCACPAFAMYNYTPAVTWGLCAHTCLVHSFPRDASHDSLTQRITQCTIPSTHCSINLRAAGSSLQAAASVLEPAL